MTTPIDIRHINADNKQYYARKFAEKLVSDMDNKELIDTAKEYFYRDKMREPISILEEEIYKSFPELLQSYSLEREAHHA